MNYLIEKGFEGYPAELPYQGSIEEIMSLVNENLIAVSTSALAQRILTEEEIADHRSLYTKVVEVDRVECREQMVAIAEKIKVAKDQLKSAEERFASIEVQISDHVNAINKGYVELNLDPEHSIAICVDNKKLHYTFANDRFVLAQVTPCSDSNVSLFDQQLLNQEKFLELFGVEFTPDCSYRRVAIEDAEGLTLAKSIIVDGSVAYTELDEETGAVIDVMSKDTLAIADQKVDEELIKIFKINQVNTVIVYAETEA